MEEHIETFSISVQINPGLEPIRFNVIVEENDLISGYKLTFKLERDHKTVGVLSPDTDGRWKRLEGEIEQQEVNLIGAAIDTYYA